jgi:hypothetical protein
MADAPDPYAEIALVSLSSVRGVNFWATRPVTRLDVRVGAYDEIASHEVDGLTEQLLATMPGLWEHRCGLGERGGFVTRLRRGTYAPHIAEHIALELQEMVGHRVGFGRARGGDRPGEYTVVFEHRDELVGLRAAAWALDIVQRAFAGTLTTIEPALAELRALAACADAPHAARHVLCGVTGGRDRAGVREQMLRLGAPRAAPIVELAPAYLLAAGVPYSTSAAAVITDARLDDVPARYREADHARRLVAVVADTVRRDGVVVAPAGDAALHALVLEAGRRLALFAADGPPGDDERSRAHAVAYARGERIVVERDGDALDAGGLEAGRPPAAQLAAALAMHSIRELSSIEEETADVASA